MLQGLEKGGKGSSPLQAHAHSNIITTTFVWIGTDSSIPTLPELTKQHHAPYYSYYIPEADLDSLLEVHDAPPYDCEESILSGASTPTDAASSIDSPHRVSVRRSLTEPLAAPIEDAMNLVEDAHPLPGSPPDLTGSKSSKSSSFHSSYHSDDGSILADVGHFEDIGLDDDARSEREIGDFDMTSPNPLTASYELRSKRPTTRKSSSQTTVMPRELTSTKTRPVLPSIRSQIRHATEPQGLGLMPISTMSRRGFTSPSTPTLSMSGKRHRSPSPNGSVSSASSLSLPSARFSAGHPRRGSWQSTQSIRDRKTQAELEKECDDDDGDDVPDEFVLENVPMSPRPPEERRRSTATPSPDRPGRKEKSKPAGNGTPLVPVEQGSLRSPSSPGKPPMGHRGISMGQFPINHDSFPMKGRAKSWTAVLSELSEEAKSLTEALEAHADEQKNQPLAQKQRRSRSTSSQQKPRVKSSFAELPPLRRTDIMIDPLPISKEKEAVLSRTRPSWLPPKDPAEEKRHLKEYQRMMALSRASEQKREEEKKSRVTHRDDTASSLLRIWEEHVLPNWDHALAMKRTRELWWRGISPRSRGTVWARSIGNELELSDASYTAALSRARDLERKLAKREGTDEEIRMAGWFKAIRRDVATTYPELRIFQTGGPLSEPLVDVLMAYAMYRSDVGYVPGTNTMTALLLLNLPNSATTFITLSNALNRPLPLSFLTHDYGAISRVHALTLSTLAAKLPTLYQHLCAHSIGINKHPSDFLDPAFAGLFTTAVDLDAVTRLWDVWVFEGDAVLVRAAVALFSQLENKLYGTTHKDEVLNILRQGPEGGHEDEWMSAVRDAGRNGVSGASGSVSPAPKSGER